MADIDQEPFAQTELSPDFARELRYTQNGKFRIHILGAGFYRRYSLVYRDLTLLQMQTLRELYESKSDGATFTAMIEGEEVTLHMLTAPHPRSFADWFEVRFAAREAVAYTTGSGIWRFTVADTQSRFVPAPAISVFEGDGGEIDVANPFGAKLVGKLLWITEWLSRTDWVQFMGDYQSLQNTSWNVVWPADNETYEVFYGAVPFQVEQEGPLFRLSHELEIRRKINTSDYRNTETGDRRIFENGDARLLEDG